MIYIPNYYTIIIGIKSTENTGFVEFRLKKDSPARVGRTALLIDNVLFVNLYDVLLQKE